MELIDKFIKFEYEEDLFNKEIQGVKFWHYIRFSIYNKILKQKYNIGRAHSNLSGNNFFKKVLLRINQIPNYIFKNPLWGLKKKDILVLNISRRIKNKKYYDCIYTDEILKNIKKSYYVFEQPYLGKHFNPINSNNIRYMDYIELIISLNTKMNNIFHKDLIILTKNEMDNLIILKEEINKNFNIKISINFYKEIIIDLIRSYRIFKKYYEIILNKVKPKIILEVCSYSFKNLLMNELAKKRGILTVELQHGTMGKYHIAYNFYKKIELETFPNYIFLFGNFWKKNTRLPIDKQYLIVTGFPYFENKLKELTKFSRKDRKKKNILFISQGTIGKKLSQLAVQLNRIINHKKYNIIYKLHPGEYTRWKDEYSWLKESNIEVIDNNKNDIYYYFSKCNFQVGVYSTAIFEGLGLKLITFIYKVYGYKHMEDLCKDGYAMLINSAKEISVNLEKSFNKNIKINKIFWESDSIKKITNNIDSIIES